MSPNLYLYILVVTIPLILLYCYLTRHFNYWKTKNVPYFKPIPIFGNVYYVFILKTFMGDFIEQLYKQTKNQIYGFFVFDQPYLLVRDPEIIKRMLVKDFDHFNDRSVADNKQADFIGSNSLFILKNPAWLAIRHTFTFAFNTSNLTNMFPFVRDVGKELNNHLRNVAIKQSSTDAREVAMRFTTDVIASCTFGKNTQSLRYEKSGFRDITRRIFDGVSVSRKIQMASYFFAPFSVKLFGLKFIDPVAAALLKDIFITTTTEREKTNVFVGDLVDILIQIRKKNGDKFDMDMAIGVALNFFMAGFETTGSTIAFALYELCLHPEIQRRVRKEIQTVIQPDETTTYDIHTLHQMNYMGMVIKETLRKYPILPFLGRRCNKPYKIPELDLTIEKGVPVYMSLLGLHFDPEYFPNPNEFDPERFTDENIVKIPNTCYMPFGLGPRNCIGTRLGLLIVKVALISILTEFEVVPTSTTDIPLVYDPKGFVLSPINGINLKFKRIS